LQQKGHSICGYVASRGPAEETLNGSCCGGDPSRKIKGKIFKGSFGKSRPAGDKKTTGNVPAVKKES
jgi:30S ribosomal protein S31